jgi:hypothetical protein
MFVVEGRVSMLEGSTLDKSVPPPPASTNARSLDQRKYACAVQLKNLKLLSHPNEPMCAELDALKHDAGKVLRELKNIRRSRDVSFYEDAELNRRKRESLNAVLKHLLVGHDGKPCPAGDRPIVRPAPYRRKR